MKRRVLSLFLIVTMVLSIVVACGEEEKPIEKAEAPLVVGYTSFHEMFSPFFASSEADKDVVAMTQVNLLTLDREGNVIYHAIEGETTSYNGTDYTYYGIADIDVKAQRDGTVVYDIILRDDVKFSDGEVLNAEDLIFSMYVLCDPLYDGPYTFGKAPILGLEEYQSSMISLFKALISAGRENTDYTLWDQATQEKFWEELEVAGTQFAQDIVDYLEETSDTTSVATAAKLWGYDSLAENASATEFFYAMCEAYEWDLEALNNTECVGKSLFALMENYDTYTKGVQVDLEVTNIAGIEAIGEYSVRVTMTEQNVANIHYFNIPIAPVHYYGNPSIYQPDENRFGFVKGDLSLLNESAQYPNKAKIPMGAGPYVFVPTEEDNEKNDISEVHFKANENYFMGKPKTQEVHFVEIASNKKINGIVNEKIDLTRVSLTKKVANNIATTNQKEIEEAVAEAEKNGMLLDPATIADVVSYESFDYPGYGYIGMNANLVCVDEDADSNASKNLRKAFATLFSVYRDEVIATYYGGNASIVNYPVSNASWVAPDSEDKGYQVAYTKGVDRKPIYTEDMSMDEKYVAAKEAALSYFEAAGYSVEDGIVKAAPKGASMSYKVWVTGNGLGEHPSYMILNRTKAVLAEIGINLIIEDVFDEQEMWTALQDGTCAMWLASWDSSADPDIYEIYHSEGAYNYMYGIQDETLSRCLEEARKESKTSSREKLYKQAYDIILDWAVEVPVYQKQEAIIYSDARVDADTMVPDMTCYYGWIQDVHNIELYDIVIEQTE